MSLDVRIASSISIEPKPGHPSASQNLIFFITGNPGLISYYTNFFETLHELLSEDKVSSSNQFHIYGQSLAGFEDESTSVSNAPYSLQDQIKITLKALQNRRISYGPRKGQPYDSIILMGHSVGSYILLEIIQRLRKSSSPILVNSGILLFPTVTHISESPSGAGITRLFKIPDFPRKASVAAKALIWLVPRAFLGLLIRMVTGMPDDAAETTMGFLQSQKGIWQALHLAKDEMETITEDSWDEDIWGIEHEARDAKHIDPKLIFYFGQNDHWVADHTRDALIAARSQKKDEKSNSKPIMMIDESGIPHGFCINHSEVVAEKVKQWIVDLLAK